MLRKVVLVIGISLAGYLITEQLLQWTKRPKNRMLGLKKKKLGRYTVGLTNRQNDCFANCNLQALAALPTFYQWCANQSLTKSSPGMFCKAAEEMFLDLNESIMKPKSLSAWKFLSVLERIHNSRISRSQHDAHELLHLILETLEDELKTSDAKILFPFRGETLDIIACCNCGYSPPTKSSSFLVLSLMVPQKKHTSLSALLDTISKPELIDDYGCSCCRLKSCEDERIKQTYMDNVEGIPGHILKELPSPKSKIAKNTKFKRLPPLLAIHLSRSIYSVNDQPWGGGASRNSCKVSYPELLDLFTEEDVSPSDDPLKNVMRRKRRIYRLMAIIRHRGTHHTGHYECFRRKDFSWFSEPRLNAEKLKSNSIDGHVHFHTPAPVKSCETANTLDELQSTDQLNVAPPPIRRSSPSISTTDMNSKPASFSPATLTPISPYTWWRISDEKVWECNTKDVLKEESGAYMLFYQEINPEM